MKTISKIFGLSLVLGLSFGFSSCSGDDDNGPAAVPQQGTFTHTYSIPLNGNPTTANPSLSTPITIKLSEAIGEERTKNFINGSASPILAQMSIKVRGLAAIKEADRDETLENFTVKVGNKAEAALGTCDVMGGGSNFYSDIALQDVKYLKISQDVFELLVKDKQVNISYKFKPAVTIATTEGLNPVYLDIIVSGTYQYNTYPSN